MSAGGLVPAARSPHDGGISMYENMTAARAAGPPAAARRAPGAETPVFDKLLTEYRDEFRTVPGEAWTPHPAPRFAELGGTPDRFQLPPGNSGFQAHR